MDPFNQDQVPEENMQPQETMNASSTEQTEKESSSFAYQKVTPPPFNPQFNGNANKNGFAVASMILGIVAIVLGCCSFISIPCGIVGLVLGILSLKSEKRGMAIAGIVLSGIGIVATIVISIIAYITQIGVFEGILSDFGDTGYYYYS